VIPFERLVLGPERDADDNCGAAFPLEPPLPLIEEPATSFEGIFAKLNIARNRPNPQNTSAHKPRKLNRPERPVEGFVLIFFVISSTVFDRLRESHLTALATEFGNGVEVESDLDRQMDASDPTILIAGLTAEL
jgi:hypothetical protein